MIELTDFQIINPNDPENPFKKDCFEEFRNRFLYFFPNFPNDVIKEWAYRHFDDFCSHYWYLDFQSFLFHKKHFDIRTIVNLKTRMTDSELKTWGNNYLNREELHLQGNWLFNYMSTHPTWPQPIIVLDTSTCPINKQEKLHKPYHLLEGHMRLAIIQAKMRNNEWVLPTHEVWLVEIKDNEIQ